MSQVSLLSEQTIRHNTQNIPEIFCTSECSPTKSMKICCAFQQFQGPSLPCRHAKNLKKSEEKLENKAAGAAKQSGRKVEGAAEQVAEEETSLAAKIAAPTGLVLGLAAILGGGYLYKDQLRGFIDYFILVAEQWGPLGYVQSRDSRIRF